MHNPPPMRKGDDEFKAPRPIGDESARTLSPNEDPKPPRPFGLRKKHTNEAEASETPGAFGFKRSEDEGRELHV